MGKELTASLYYHNLDSSFNLVISQFDSNNEELSTNSVNCSAADSYSPSVSITTVENVAYVKVTISKYGAADTKMNVDNICLSES